MGRENNRGSRDDAQQSVKFIGRQDIAKMIVKEDYLNTSEEYTR